MTALATRLTVHPDGAISAATPLLPGEYQATISVPASPAPGKPYTPGKPFTMDGLPIHDMGWDDSISLRREDMYGDDGRLFPSIRDNAHARECARIIAGWKPLPVS